MFTCYVAIGDSLTEGFGDHINGYPNNPFPEQLATLLNISNVHNLGKSGLRSDQIIKSQLTKALELKPDLISITAGGNDILQKRWNKWLFKRRMRKLLKSLKSESCVILTCTIPDLFDFLTLPKYQLIVGRRWVREFNEAMNELSAEFQTVHLDFSTQTFANDFSYWSKDSIHPNTKGYQEVANAFAQAIQSHVNNLKESIQEHT